MSTNYELRTNICGQCNRYDEYHIGKLSAGWTFLFHGEKEQNTGLTPQDVAIQSFEDWIPFLKHGKIFDEYGMWCQYDDFLALVQELSCNARRHADEYPEHSWLDNQGHSFSSGVFS